MSIYPAYQQARAIAYNSQNGQIAVSNNYGDVSIYDYNDISKRVTTIYKPEKWCETLVYSPCGTMLAIGSHDCQVYVYKIEGEEYKLIFDSKYSQSSAITAMDWSRDSKYIRAIDQAYMKVFYNIEERAQIQDQASELLDTMLWATSTCKLGWEAMGVYPKQDADGSDINAVDADEKRELMVAGDDFNSIRIFNYPVINSNHQCIRLLGHSEHVAKVRFVNGGSERRIISCGGNDKTIIQWKEVSA